MVVLVWCSLNWEDGTSQSSTVVVVEPSKAEMKLEVQTLSLKFTLGAETWGKTGSTSSHRPNSPSSRAPLLPRKPGGQHTGGIRGFKGIV